MPTYVFLKKDNRLSVLEKSDIDGAMALQKQGYDKQFEEIDAPDAKHALSRFADIKKDEATTEYAFSTGAAFIALMVGLIAVAGFLFLP